MSILQYLFEESIWGLNQCVEVSTLKLHTDFLIGIDVSKFLRKTEGWKTKIPDKKRKMIWNKNNEVDGGGGGWRRL